MNIVIIFSNGTQLEKHVIFIFKIFTLRINHSLFHISNCYKLILLSPYTWLDSTPYDPPIQICIMQSIFPMWGCRELGTRPFPPSHFLSIVYRFLWIIMGPVITLPKIMAINFWVHSYIHCNAPPKCAWGHLLIKMS